ncbi:hypothetical protein CR513_08221, partial [Mucuna pruriens]
MERLNSEDSDTAPKPLCCETKLQSHLPLPTEGFQEPVLKISSPAKYSNVSSRNEGMADLELKDRSKRR